MPFSYFLLLYGENLFNKNYTGLETEIDVLLGDLLLLILLF